MLRLASLCNPLWGVVSRNAPWVFVSSGIYFLGLHFNEEVATLLVVEGASMRPTLNPETMGEDSRERTDVCILRKWRYIPTRGDVVCLNAPRKSGSVVKRIVALPGDVVLPRASSASIPTPILIPDGHVWVEGDNAANSVDSNAYGPVPVGMLIGRVSHVLFRSKPSRMITEIPSTIPEPERFQLNLRKATIAVSPQPGL